MARICDDPQKEREKESKKRSRDEPTTTIKATPPVATAVVQTNPTPAVVAVSVPGKTGGKQPKSGAGFLGVHGHPGKYRSRIYYEGKQHYLGVFKTAEQAAEAYDRAARVHRGPNPETNFPNAQIAAARAAEAAANYIKAPTPPPQPAPKSNYYGVHATNSSKRCKWRARIYYDGKQHYIGSYRTEIEAAKAYDKVAREHRGADVTCNFPPSAESAADTVLTPVAPALPPVAVAATIRISAAVAVAVPTTSAVAVSASAVRSVAKPGMNEL